MLALCRLIADDGYAISFQSLGQYRAALIAEAHKLAAAESAEGREHGA
jgi:hypothetical protein